MKKENYETLLMKCCALPKCDGYLENIVIGAVNYHIGRDFFTLTPTDPGVLSYLKTRGGLK